MKTRLIITGALVVLVIGISHAYAADAPAKQTNQQLQDDLDMVTAEAMDRPRTRLDQALLDFRKATDKRAGK